MSQQTSAPSADNEPTIDTECMQNSQDGANQDDDDPLQEIRRLLAIDDLVGQEQNERADLVELLICRLCGNLMVKSTLLSCGHTFCRMCILTQPAPGGMRVCPQCRSVRSEQEQRARPIDSAVQALIDAHVAHMNNADRQAKRGARSNRERRVDPNQFVQPLLGAHGMGMPLGGQPGFFRNLWRRRRRRRPRRRVLPPLQRPQNRAW